MWWRPLRNRISFFLFAVPLLSLSPIEPIPPIQPVEISPSQPTFKSGSTELVVLPVVVTDKQGRFVSDLDRERFTVFDNGRKMPVALFTSEDAPVTVGLVLDTSGSMRQKIGYVVAAALRF